MSDKQVPNDESLPVSDDDLYQVARFVGVSGDGMRRLLGVLKVLGAEVRAATGHPTDLPTDGEVIDALLIGSLMVGMTDIMVPADEARRRAEAILAAAKQHTGPGEGIVAETARWRWNLIGGMAELKDRGWTVTR